MLLLSDIQRTVETSTFGAEFVALKIGMELIKSICYKLRMTRVPLEGPANILFIMILWLKIQQFRLPLSKRNQIQSAITLLEKL